MLNEQGDYDYDDDKDEYIMPKNFGAYYYAAVREEDPWGSDKMVTVVYFTPIEYYEANGYMWDQYMPVEDQLPNNLFGQACEATYTFNGTVAEAQANCEALGFKRCDRFDLFIATT